MYRSELSRCRLKQANRRVTQKVGIIQGERRKWKSKVYSWLFPALHPNQKKKKKKRLRQRNSRRRRRSKSCVCSWKRLLRERKKGGHVLSHPDGKGNPPEINPSSQGSNRGGETVRKKRHYADHLANSHNRSATLKGFATDFFGQWR